MDIRPDDPDHGLHALLVHRRNRRHCLRVAAALDLPALDSGTLVLCSVAAAAVIGGTSLFRGRGKAMHGVIGGIVIAAIDNGMGLLGFSAAAKYIVTALVLLITVTIDAVARRNRPEGT